ncbi:hypothetical protein [Clostridium sp. FS41]|uniref:hypothetical protein n=1 Tax=Clostridium sp. FS41 TaxID=1609975 RepID=UPI00061FAEC3|nr:hypothetical protein [Clostridium sp. FS41]KJJ69870.1 hypothetical protein CLFS41_36060 [Clostridium sp. FS41]
MATVDEILTRQAYAAGDETWTKDNNYPSYTMYAEPEYVPVTNKRIADFNDQVSVKGEQNAQFVGFQLPRYDDAMDLIKQNLYIHYQTVYGGSDGVPCNVSWSDNYVRMCWMIPGQATQEPGSIQMMIYATGTDSVGDRTVWKTLPATYTIHDGLEIGGGIPEPDQSWYEQFVAQMEDKVFTAQGYANDAQASKTAAAGSATAAAQSADASAQALAENKDYVESQKETFVGYNKRETDLKYANALTGSASGTGRVTVGDAWEAPIPDLEVAGKSDQFTTTGAQLFDISTVGAKQSNGIIFSPSKDGVIEAIGTATGYAYVKLLSDYSLEAGDYYISGCPSGGSTTTYLLNVTVNLTDNTRESYIDSGDGVSFPILNGDTVTVLMSLNSGVSGPLVFKPMLSKGSAKIPWEPYTGGQPSPSPDYPQPIISTGTVSTGAQLLDTEAYELGTFGNATGNPNDSEITYRWLQYIPVTEGSTIYFKKPLCICYYDSDKRFVSCDESPGIYQRLVPQTAAFIRCRTFAGDFADFNHRDYMISNNPISAWEPYTGGKPSPSEEYPQPLDVTVTGAQLMDTSRMARTHNEVLFSVKEDGSILVTGNTLQNPANSAVASTNLSPGTYCVSGSVPIGNTKIFVKAKKWYSDGTSVVINDTSFIVDGTETKIDYFIQLNQGISEFSKIVYPMLNAGPTALPWQSYQSGTATITLTEPLHGIGDVRDRIMCKDGEWGIERYCPTITFDGSTDEKWNEASTNDAAKKRYNCKVGGRSADLIHQTALCSHFPLIGAGGTLGNIRGFTIANDYIQLYLDGRPLEEFKTWLQEHPITLVYQLDTPTWEPLPAATQSALNALTTFTGTTHITITAGGPEPDVAVEYVQDTRAVIADIMAQIDEIRNGGTT